MPVLSRGRGGLLTGAPPQGESLLVLSAPRGTGGGPPPPVSELQVATGSVTYPASTGNFSVTGIGFQPVLILLFGTVISTGNQLAQFTGAADAAGNEWSITWGADAGAGTMNTVRSGSETQCIRLVASGAGTAIPICAASLVSMNSNGFTLNFTATDAALTFRYVAFGGNGVEAHVGAFSWTGDLGTQAITGVGFQPECLFVANNFNTTLGTTTSSYMGYGIATGATSRGAFACGSRDNVASAVVDTFQKTDRIAVNGQVGVGQWEVDLSSFDADGFTINGVDDNAGGDIRMGYAALRGGHFHLGSFNTRTTTGTQALTGTGFQPAAVMFYGYMQPSGALANRSMHPTFGAYDGTSEWTVSACDVHGADPSSCRNYQSSTKSLGTTSDANPTLVILEADVQSLDADGATLNYTTADATARQNLWLAIGA